MPFVWKDYLDLAQFLSVPNASFSGEAALRSATSRAYYAAYCYARNYAAAHLGFKPAKAATDHAELVAYLDGHGKQNMADKLEQMRSWRNKCDYDDSVFQLKMITEKTLDEANKVFNGLK